MQELLRLTETLADLFDALRLRHAFGGALANNLWGTVRTTVDVDCLVLIPALQYENLMNKLAELGCRLRDERGKDLPLSVKEMRRQISERKLMEIFHGEIRVELFVPLIPLQNEILRRAVLIKLEKRQIHVTTAEDLILLKMAFHREKDLRDVRGILWVQRGKLDLAYLRSWSKKMFEEKIEEELERIIQEYSSK
ncbi:MAG: hypothetical protein HY717_14650 [Planctomycetes bacterium]|nr:hypothetical protein [Planctomycetota bacterium]